MDTAVNLAMGKWKIKEVGIDFTSVRDDYGIITADCDIVGEEGGDETYDDRQFAYDPRDGSVAISHEPEGDCFSEDDYREAEALLLENISDNKDAFLKAAKPITAEEGGSAYYGAIYALTDAGLGQNLTDALVACACRSALDPYEEEAAIARTPFGAFCRTVAALWVDGGDGYCICRIAGWLVQWILSGREGYPTSYSELKEWAEGEGF